MTEDPATLALHADRTIADTPDVAPPIHVASTYDRTNQSESVYRRSHHPTTDRLEAVLGTLEGGEAVVYSSGMSAALAVLRHLRPRRVALPADVYHGVRSLMEAEARAGTLELVGAEALGAGDLRWVETPSNPKCLITDIADAASHTRSHGAQLIVDSTFATPVLQRPLEHGADYVLHSVTKFIGGHSDLMGGVVAVGSSAVAHELREQRTRDGAVIGSLDGWLALRGLRTLPLRIERQSATATSLASWLAARAPIVWHPSLPQHPGHEIALRQMSRPGGVLSFEVESGERALAVVDQLRLFRKATSLGGVESLAEWRRSVNPAAPEGLIRLSVGLEAAADLIADLEGALSR